MNIKVSQKFVSIFYNDNDDEGADDDGDLKKIRLIWDRKTIAVMMIKIMIMLMIMIMMIQIKRQKGYCFDDYDDGGD